jgi:uncharacterized protein YqfA (UPF0365 family)
MQESSTWSGPVGIAIIVGTAIVALIMLIVLLKFGLLYIQALSSGARVAMLDLVGMSLRKVNAHVIVTARVMALKAGIPVETSKLDAQYLAKGNVIRVVTALIAASKAKIPLSFDQAAAIDLAGRDVLDAVQTSVRPKVIDCPDPKKGRETLDAVAKDGIQLKVKARVTVRTNLERLVGGATEETIIARVGEGIVSSIGSAESYKSVLEYPDRISKGVLDRGWIPRRRSKSSRSTSRTWTWATTWERACGWFRRRRINGWRRPKRKRAGPWRWRANRR